MSSVRNCGIPVLLPLLVLFGCTKHEGGDRARVTFDRNVESCICRYMDIEEDNYSGLTYEQFVEDCNQTVLNSNPVRYPDSFNSIPDISELRCQELVQPWLDEVEAAQALQENNRNLFEEILGKESTQ